MLDQDFLEPEDQDVFEECYDVYVDLCRSIQEEEDRLEEKEEEKRRLQQEEQRHQAFIADLIKNYRAPRKPRKDGKPRRKQTFVRLRRVLPRHGSGGVSARQRGEAGSGGHDSHVPRGPAEPLARRVCCHLLRGGSVDGVVEHYERERQIAREEVELRERLEREEYENEYNYKLNSTGSALRRTTSRRSTSTTTRRSWPCRSAQSTSA